MRRALEHRWVVVAILLTSGVLTIVSMRRAYAEGSSLATIAPVAVGAAILVGTLVWSARLERSRMSGRRDPVADAAERQDRA